MCGKLKRTQFEWKPSYFSSHLTILLRVLSFLSKIAGLKLETDGAITSLKTAPWVMAAYFLQRRLDCECFV